MNEELNLQNFNDVRAIYNVLGNICNNTELLREDNVHLKKEDFMQRLHKIIFSAVNNIAFNTSGDKVTMVSAKDIDNYLSSYPTQYKIWNDQKGFDYVRQITEHCNEETFHQSYDRVKKMAILREYQQMGFDVSDIYEWNSDDFLAREKSLKQIDKMEMKEIFEHFTLKNLRIKDDFNIDTEGKQFKAGSNIKELLDRFKQGKEYGAPYPNEFLNFLLRGQRKGKFVLRSGASGSLKTSISIANMTNNAVNKIYKNGKWVYNGKSLPSLFISTELDEDELNVIALAYITGIPRKVIMDGLFTKEQEEILVEAGNILHESPLFMHHIPDFSAHDISDIIERNIIENDVGYISFDYIQITPKLQRSTNELFGQTQRPDEVLLHLSTSLKNIAEKYNVYIESGTQLNRSSKDEDNWDATAIRGASSIIDKVDSAMLLFNAREKHLDKVSSIVEEQGFGHEPNRMSVLFKNRAGKANVIIWSYINPSTVREEVLFCTDTDYNIVEDVEKLTFEFEEGKQERDINRDKKYSDGQGVFGSVDSNKDNDIDF